MRICTAKLYDQRAQTHTYAFRKLCCSDFRCVCSSSLFSDCHRSIFFVPFFLLLFVIENQRMHKKVSNINKNSKRLKASRFNVYRMIYFFFSFPFFAFILFIALLLVCFPFSSSIENINDAEEKKWKWKKKKTWCHRQNLSCYYANASIFNRKIPDFFLVRTLVQNEW